jgi:hypothetical protein
MPTVSLKREQPNCIARDLSAVGILPGMMQIMAMPQRLRRDLKESLC